MKLISALVAMSLFVAVQSAQAQKKQSLHDQFTGQGYGMAGCGLGSVVFGDKPGMIQVVAATVNSIGYQTLAISSGTSNCGESGKSARANQFIEVNKVALENDLSRGAGESIVSLGEVMGCKNSNFTVELRSKYTPGLSKAALVDAASSACEI